jgi:hypothetical protein
MNLNYTFKPKAGRKSNIDQTNRNSLTHLLKDKALTLEAKHDLISERNPFLLIFGDHLKAQKPYEEYADWVNRLYIGDAKCH